MSEDHRRPVSRHVDRRVGRVGGVSHPEAGVVPLVPVVVHEGSTGNPWWWVWEGLQDTSGRTSTRERDRYGFWAVDGWGFSVV